MMLDEIKDDIMNILLHIHVYNEKSKRILDISRTRYELAYEIIALNSIAQDIILRTSRLGDKRKDVRSIKNVLKNISNYNEDLVNIFYNEIKKVLKIRHEQIAHMKLGTVSEYPIEQIPKCVYTAINALVNLIDNINGAPVEYTYSVGSQEQNINLRQSVEQNKTIYVN